MNTTQQNLLQTAHEKAVETLHKCTTPYGFRASGLPAGYPQVWARDMGITSLGAFASQDNILIECVRKSLETLSQYQSKRGLIPLNVNPDTGYISTENAGAADANLWYIIAHYMYYQTTKDYDFLHDHWNIITRAMQWLEFQDMNECGLLEIPEAANWMDLVSVRYNTLYDNVLYYAATLAYEELYKVLPDDLHVHDLINTPGDIHERLNLLMWIDRCWIADHFAEHLEKLKSIRLEWFMLYHNIGTISSRPFYLPWVAFREYGDWCDTLGNCLAILTGIADGHRTEHILRYMYQVNISEPYPAKAIYPPIYPGENDWRDYYRSRNLNLPHQYHNGGIWLMVGGFHVAALVRHKWHSEAERILTLLAKACHQGAETDWGFNEWMHGDTGHAMGYDQQAWSAAMYLYAEYCVQNQQALLFDDLLASKPASAVQAENNDFAVHPGGGPS